MTTNAHAVTLIEEMIADTKDSITLTESNLQAALTSLHSRYSEVAAALEAGNGIYETGISQAAAKVEKYVADRTSLYSQLRTLEYVVRPAAGE